MASERTCGECRDCRHWGSEPMNCNTQRLCAFRVFQDGRMPGTGPHFGCVLFEAKPAPEVVKFLALNGNMCDLESIKECVTKYPENVREIPEFTHVYSVGSSHYLFRYAEETDR